MPMPKYLLFFLFLPYLLPAQEYNYTTIDSKMGLPSSEVYAILQDKLGYMWFATDHGVARYNGSDFTTYTFSEGLTDNTILRMCEDHKGRIWFASHSNELFYWEKGRIHPSSLSSILRITLPGWISISTLYLDSADNIWVNCALGLYFSDAKRNYTTLVRKNNFPGRSVSIEIVDGSKALDLKNRNWKLFQKKDTDPSLSFRLGYRVKGRIEERDTILPVGEFKSASFSDAVYSKNGNLVYSRGNTLFFISKKQQLQLKEFDHEIIKLYLDRENNLWVCLMKGGTYCYRNSDLHSPPVHILNGITVSDVCMGHSSAVWIATLERGVFYIPSLHVLSYSNIPLLNDHITYLGRMNNKLLIGTFGNMLFEQQQHTIVPHVFFNNLSKRKIKLFTAKEINNNTYLLWQGRTDILDKNLNRIGPNEAFLPYTQGKDVIEAEDHSVWILNSGSFKELTCRKEPTKFFNVPFRVNCAIADKGSRLMVGSKQGMYFFDKGKITWLNYLSPLLKCPIVQLLRDTDQTIWIATAGNGLLKWKDNKITQINVKDGLLSNICTTLAKDDQGDIWVGTNKGLNCIHWPKGSEKEPEIKRVTVNNGLSSNEITKLYTCSDTVWAGTLMGLNRVDKTYLFADTTFAPVYIQSILANNVIADGTLSFPYNHNNIKFRLEGLVYSDNREHRYRYQLLGLDSTWQETNANDIQFNSLPSGSFTFQAQVMDSNGAWSKTGAVYHFTVRKPFWFTWWFISLEVIGLIGFIYLIIQLQIRKITRRENEKARINKLLNEYQMKALTAQMNPHFIFNAISSIQNFIMQNHTTFAYGYLEKFSRLIRLVLNHSNEAEISIQQEIDTLRLYVELEQLRFKDAFDFELLIDPVIRTEEILIPALLMQPYIENAIWHGLMPLKTRKGIITLKMEELEDTLKITIRDNGVGRKASNKIQKKVSSDAHQSIGMKLTGKRVELFANKQSAHLKIIDNYNDQQEATGTTVEIIIPKVEIY